MWFLHGLYGQLTRHLRRKHNLQVTRDTVMKFLRIFDPEGVECRKRRRLKRRRYITPGPNFLWHVHGWDKLAHFGIFIHGAVDGFSRRILWLEANSTNKNLLADLDPPRIGPPGPNPLADMDPPVRIR